MPHSFDETQIGSAPCLAFSMCMWLNGVLHHSKNRSTVFSQVDGRHIRPPISPSAGLKIFESSSRIHLKSDFGLLVEFSGHGAAGKWMWPCLTVQDLKRLHFALRFVSTEIVLPRIYRRKLGGMCGNLDQQRQNDWMKPDGTFARTVREFGESWRVWILRCKMWERD